MLCLALNSDFLSFRSMLTRPEFPRSNGYDPDWVMSNQMGPNPLWLVEWLTRAMHLQPGMRVLDLGCGTAMTSIFLAREFDAQVWAADLWVDPDDNWRRIQEMNVEDRVSPLRSEAHDLPFAAGFFDAVVSVDAYQYFGTDDLYLHYLARFVRPGGEIGVVAVGLTHDLPGGQPPSHLLAPQANGKVFWEDECICFHTAAWWRSAWTRSGRVEVRTADTMPDGWRHWRDFERALEASGKGLFPSDAEALERDSGRFIGFVRLVAERRPAEGPNLYEPGLFTRLTARG